MKSILIILLLILAIMTCSYETRSQEKQGNYLQEARKLQSEGKNEQAVELLNKAIEKEPKFKEAYYLLGSIYIGEEYFQKAGEVYNKLNSIIPDDPLTVYFIAVSEFLSYDYVSAQKNLEKILKNNPRDTISRGYLILTLSREGQNDRALEELMNIVRCNLKGDSDFSIYTKIEEQSLNVDQLTPNLQDIREIPENNIKNPYSNTILGWFAYNDKSMEKAHNYLKTAVEVNQNDPVAHYLLGLLSYNLNDGETAVTEYEKAYKLDEKFVKSIQEKLQYIEGAKRDRQILEWEKKLTEEPENDNIMFELSKYYYNRASNGQALDLILKAIKIKSQEGKYYNLLGKIYINQNDWTGAIGSFKKACDLDKTSEEYWANLSYACEKAGRYKESIEAGEKSLGTGKEDKTVYTSMAISYYYLEDFDKSIATFKKAVEKDPKNGELLCRYAIALQWRGMLEEAAKNYKKSIENLPDLIDSYYYLGNTFMSLGNYEEAKKYFQKVMDMRSGYKSIYMPNFNETLVNLAQANLELNNPQKALEGLDSVIKGDPLNVRAHLFKAYAYEKLNKEEEARKEYIKTFSIISSVPIETPDEELTPYSEGTLFSPKNEPVIHYSVSMEDQWITKYPGEPQFVLKTPERKEKEIENDIKLKPSGYEPVLELIELYLYQKRPKEALDKISVVDPQKAGEAKIDNLKGIIYTFQGKTDLALIEFNKALEKNPESFEVHNNIAVVYQILKNYNPAIEHLKKSIELNFLNPWAYNNLGIIYNEQKNYTLAEENLYFAKVSDLKSPWIRHNLGWTYYKLNRFTEAIKEMTEAIKQDPKEASFPSDLGWVYSEKGDTENALNYYYKALEINPQKDSLYNAIGIMLSRQNKYVQAISNYRRAININPKEELYHRNLGIAYYKLNKYAKAQKEFEEAFNINEFSPENNINLSSCLFKQGKVDEGNIYLKNAISYNERDYNPLIDLIVLNNQGALYLEQGKFDLAEHQLQNIINYKDTYKGLDKYIGIYYAETYNNLAILKYRQGLTDEAIEMLSQAQKLIPDYTATFNNLAIVSEKKDEKKSEELYQKAIKIQPQIGLYYNNLAVLYLKQGNNEKAIELLKKGIEKDKNLQLLHYNLAGAYLNNHMIEEALQEFKAIPEQSQIAPEASYGLGLIYYRQGKKILAQERYEKAISMKKGSDNLMNAGWTFLNMRAYKLALEKFTGSIKINPLNASSYAGLATCYFNMSDMAKARETADKGIKADPKSEKSYIIRSLIYYHNKEFNNAIEDLKKAMSINPENSLLLYNYAYFLQEHGDIDNAIKTYEKAISVDKKSTLSVCANSFIFLFKGDYEKAKANAYQVIQNDMTFADAYYILGKVAEKEGNKSRAIFEYKRALKADPMHLEAAEGIERLK